MKLIAFILLIIGTIGLLLSELVFAWGRVVTIIFAASNLIGLATLVCSLLVMTKKHINDEETQLGKDEQYHRMYGDDLPPKN